jgi:hypothetical protein
MRVPLSSLREQSVPRDMALKEDRALDDLRGSIRHHFFYPADKNSGIAQTMHCWQLVKQTPRTFTGSRVIQPILLGVTLFLERLGW